MRDDDAVDAHLLADAIGGDPLVTLKILAHVGQVQRARGRDPATQAETVTEALVMLGIPPFFAAFSELSSVDEWFGSDAQALAGFEQVLTRSYRAARFAIAFAVHRMDHDAALIGEAALLHDVAELLLWLRSPPLAKALQDRKLADPGLRSSSAQREVLNVELSALQFALMTRWGLPEALIAIVDHRHRDTHQLRAVQLAVRVARHSARSWDDPAIPDDVREISSLLNLSMDATWRLLHEIDKSE